MSNRENHIELLKVPYQKRGSNWHLEVKRQFKIIPAVCSVCGAKFHLEIFKDEPNPTNPTCPLH